MPRWPEKARVINIHQTATGMWSAMIECPDGERRRFRTARAPIVIEYVKRPTRRPVRLRFDVLARDRYTCRYCGRKAPDVELVVDHIVPVVKGGTNEPANLVTACEDCNSGKGKRHSGGVVETRDDLYRSNLELASDAIARLERHIGGNHMAAKTAADGAPEATSTHETVREDAG